MIPSKIILGKVDKYFTSTHHSAFELRDINASFVQGKSYAIKGKSGSGKSTLMHIIAGLDIPSSGAVLFNNQPLHNFIGSEKTNYFNSSIGLVFQSSYSIPELSVIENVMLPSMIKTSNTTDCYQKALALLERVGLLNKKDASPRSLSGGQQQRLSLARALINNPCFLIADEPTGNLDYATGESIVNLMLECQRTWGMGIIVSSHDDYVVNRMDKQYELSNSTLIKKR